jgi:hypothetical protein
MMPWVSCSTSSPTCANETVLKDANDFIYVRAPPRVGLRYQVTLGADNIGASKVDSSERATGILRRD